eukprot:CAMPEP_0204627032 /NCGR_PEP_ID=MMETSP0717-20131115/12897_1 /ASSEMBLY_ACC=CAM_ASM_000666 /TAXON_ID=230516 /ORGANISM="Chaetoceros curvisetus" /LENGTH=132 /DNA_ID=CAMNT_0051643147 /DNA_START=40 /DNA_END=438 /DNA_ORIENTATION=-
MKCEFSKALVESGEIPKYIWEEFLYVTDDKMVVTIQDENRPAIIDCIGKVYHLEAIDGESEWTRVSMSHLYRPNFMPLTSMLATSVMKQSMGDQIYALAWGIKHYRESSNPAVYTEVEGAISLWKFIHFYHV